MNFLKIKNTRLITNIRPFIKNGTFRYSHHDSQHYYLEPYYLSQKERDIKSLLGEERTQKIIINLLGEYESVDKASWEINTFAQEKPALTWKDVSKWTYNRGNTLSSDGQWMAGWD